MKSFKFYDSIMLVSPTGQKASNLKEFLHIIEESADNVIFHHLYQSHLKYYSNVGEFPNDFANWVAYELGDIALAEKLANFNPYNFKTVDDDKNRIIEILEEHLWDLPVIPWVIPGSEFYFCSATTILMPLNIKASNLAELRRSLDMIPNSSLYFHFYEERKRNKEKEHDDFSYWIEQNCKLPDLVREIRDIDFYFFSLEETRNKLIELIEKYL